MCGHRRCLQSVTNAPISMVARVRGHRALDTAVVLDDHSHLHHYSQALRPPQVRTRALTSEMAWTGIRSEVVAGPSITIHAAAFAPL